MKTLEVPARPLEASRQTVFYSQLRNRLWERLVRPGQPGTRLPSERQLARDFDTSVMTIGRILQEFQSEGYVQRVPGKGTYLLQCAGPEQAESAVGADSGASATVVGGNAGAWGEGSGVAPQMPLWDHLMGRGGQELPLQRPRPRPGRTLKHTCIVVNLSSDPEHQSREYWSHRVTSVLERQLQKMGVRTTLLDRHDATEADIQAFVPRMIEAEVDSILYVDGGSFNFVETNKTLLWQAQMLRWKYAMAGRGTAVTVQFGDQNALPLDAIGYSGSQGAVLATNHLTELGHTSIAFLSRAITASWIQGRGNAFLQALQLAGVDDWFHSPPDLQADPRCFFSDEPPLDLEDMDDWTWAAKDVVAKFFASEENCRRFTGIVALNDQIAEEFIHEAVRRGYRVPGDFSVVGFDDRLSSKALGLTTIHPPIEELGEVAAGILARRHAETGQTGQFMLVLEPTLVLRSSTGPPA